MRGYRIDVSKADLADNRPVEAEFAARDGEVVAQVEHAALTANNVTYAVHSGPPLHYGRFFPAADDGHITVPVWGFGRIVESRAPGVAVGDRFYGYWPSGSHVVLRPGKVGASGFSDLSAHREGLAPVYNAYVAAAIAAPTAEAEAAVALFRPLFGTAHVLDDFLGRMPAAPTVILTSASCKTALGTAWGLQQRRTVKVIGLTSARNRDFVMRTGYYDTVLVYDEVHQLDADAECVLVDFSGNGALKLALHRRLKGLAASHIVGDTHWSEPQPDSLPGPTPALFFAPAVWQARALEIGAATFEAQLQAASTRFLASAEQWLRVEHVQGAGGWQAEFARLLDGRSDPACGVVVHF